MPVEAVIFDCDGVLVDSEPIANGVHERLLGALGIIVSLEDMIERYTGVSDTTMYADLEAQSGRALPADYDRRFRQELAAAYVHALRPVPGIEAVLRNLSLPKAVASNSTEAILHHALASCGLKSAFGDNILSSERAARPKPAPDVYLMAAEQLRVAPADCVVVEDSVAGATAGVDAGMTVISFVGTAHNPKAQHAKLKAAGVRKVVDTMPAVSGAIGELQAAAA